MTNEQERMMKKMIAIAEIAVFETALFDGTSKRVLEKFIKSLRAAVENNGQCIISGEVIRIEEDESSGAYEEEMCFCFVPDSYDDIYEYKNDVDYPCGVYLGYNESDDAFEFTLSHGSGEDDCFIHFDGEIISRKPKFEVDISKSSIVKDWKKPFIPEIY